MRTILTILLIFISGITFGQSKEKYVNYMDSLLKINQHAELILFFKKELKKYPNNEDILRSLGYVYIANGNLDLGEEFYLQALSVNPECGRCYLNIGRVYVLRNENKKALEYLNKAVVTDPNDPLILTSRAKLKQLMSDKFGALRDHDKAIELDSTISVSYIERGNYYSDYGYSELALSDLNKAIELSPQNYYSYSVRASEFYKQQNFEAALKDIEAALAIDSSQHSLYTSKGAVLGAMKKYDEAIKNYDKAISLNSYNYLPILNRASAYYNLESIDAACSDYNLLESLIENGIITEKNYIKEISDAIQDFCDPSKPSYYYQRGIGFYNLKEYQNAIDIYEEGALIFPDNLMILLFKGNAYLVMNEYENAIACYNRVLNNKETFLNEIISNPRFANAEEEQVKDYYDGSIASTYYSLAECRIKLNEFDEALNDINSAIKLAPNVKGFNLESYYNLRGNICLIKEKYEQAISDFNKSIELNSDFTIAYVNRAVANVSSMERTTNSNYSIKGNHNSHLIAPRWDLPNKSSLKKMEYSLKLALSDCDEAIKLDVKLGEAYYIRGQIKQMLKEEDFCLDFFTAKELGITVETELLNHCLK